MVQMHNYKESPSIIVLGETPSRLSVNVGEALRIKNINPESLSPDIENRLLIAIDNKLSVYKGYKIGDRLRGSMEYDVYSIIDHYIQTGLLR